MVEKMTAIYIKASLHLQTHALVFYYSFINHAAYDYPTAASNVFLLLLQPARPSFYEGDFFCKQPATNPERLVPGINGIII